MATNAKIYLLGEPYYINLPNDDVETLNKSAELFQKYLSESREKGGIVGSERMAMMAGLNLASDYIQLKNQQISEDVLAEDIKYLCNKIETSIKELTV